MLYEHLIHCGTKLLENGEKHLELFCREVQADTSGLLQVNLFKDEAEQMKPHAKSLSLLSCSERYPLQCCGRYYGWLLLDQKAQGIYPLFPVLARILAESYGTILYALETALLAYGDSRFSASASRLELTSRQREVLQLMAQGQGEKEIASILHIKVDTVRKHREGIYASLGVHTSHEAMRRAFLLGLCQPLSNLAPFIH